jgi:hypothetical protein
MRFRLFAAVVGFASLHVDAQTTIYTWVDGQGVTHFTDNANEVPKGVAAETTIGDDLSYASSPHRETAPVAGPAPVDAAEAKRDAEAVETQWRARFREARVRIAELTDVIEVDTQLVEGQSGLVLTAQQTCPSQRVVQQFGFAGDQRQPADNGAGVAVTGPSVWGQGFGRRGCFPNPEFERRRERLMLNRRALLRAKADLEELERQAAYNAIPLEWRR